MIRRLAKHREGPAIATFTPLKVKLDKGVLTYSDLVMTIDNLDVRFAGAIDQKQGYADLRMGISGRTLGKVHRDLREVIGEDEYLEVPISGKIDELKLDKAVGSLVGEITKLIARAAIKKEVGGVEGQLLDAILGGGKGGTPKDGEPDKNNAQEGDKPDVVGDLFKILGEAQRRKEEKKKRKKEQSK